MKKKKNRIFLAVMMAFVIYGLWKLNKDVLLLWNVNIINVSTENALSKNKVRIEARYNCNPRMILYDGERKQQLENEYGENDFLVIYDNKYFLSFRHFKTNRRHQHTYNFHLIKRNNEIILTTDIKGQDDMKFEDKMVARY